MHATTCCGRDLRKTRRRKRLDSVDNTTIYDVFDDIELQPAESSTRTLPGGPTLPPPLRSQTRAHSFYAASLSRAGAKSNSKLSRQDPRASSSANPQELRKILFHKRVDRAKPVKSLWRRSSESNLFCLKEMPNESASDMGSRASRCNFTESNESVARSGTDTVEERRFATPADLLSIDLDLQSAVPTTLRKCNAAEVSNVTNKGKKAVRTTDVANDNNVNGEGASHQGSQSSKNTTPPDSDSRENEKSWIKAEAWE